MTRPEHISDERLVDLWLAAKAPATQKAYSNTVATFQSLLTKPLAEATLDDFLTFMRRYDDSPAATFNSALSAVRSLYELGHRAGILPTNHVALIPLRRNTRTRANRVPSQDEINILFSSRLPSQSRLVCGLLYILGLRSIELRRLTLGNIVEDELGFLFQVTGKYNSWRIVRLPSSQAWLIRSVRRKIATRTIEGAKSKDTFLSSPRGHPVRHATIYKIVNEAGKRADLKKALCPHLLRHAHCSHALDNGAPPHLVQKSLGLKCMSTMSRYAHSTSQTNSSAFIPLPR